MVTVDESQRQDVVDMADTVAGDLRFLAGLTAGHDVHALFLKAAQVVQEALDALGRGVARNGG